MGTILAISSQVARGHVGLAAAVPALHALGHEVIALPTVLLSNHPGHGAVAGQRIDPVLLGQMLATLDAHGWLARVDAVLSGYLPTPGHVAVVEDAIARVRARNPAAAYFCDPVLGDDPKGLYIAEDAARALHFSDIGHSFNHILLVMQIQIMTSIHPKTQFVGQIASCHIWIDSL
jgi:pyridoxine kinase